MQSRLVVLSLLALLIASPCFAPDDKIKVAIIDSGLDLKDPRFQDTLCPDGHRDFSGYGIQDDHGHGTHVAGTIKKVAGPGNYCFVILKFQTGYDLESGSVNLRHMVEAIREARKVGASIVNISGGGPAFSEEEYLAIRYSNDVTFIVAAGNENQDIGVPTQEYYPASYRLENIKVIGALATDGVQKLGMSNWGKGVDYWEIGEGVYSTLPDGRSGWMSGTSMATAVATGKFLRGQLFKRSAPSSTQ